MKECDDLISRNAVIDKIEELLKSPFANDPSPVMAGRREAIKTVRDMCVKCMGAAAYDVNRVKERIKEEIGACECKECGKYYGNCDACREEKAMEIVKSGFASKEVGDD